MGTPRPGTDSPAAFLPRVGAVRGRWARTPPEVPSGPGSALTQRAEEADVVVGAGLALWLLLVDAPKALLGAEMHHLAHVLGQLPLGGARLDGNRPRADASAVVEADGIQALVVAVPPGVVDVEPRRPFSPSACMEPPVSAQPPSLSAPMWPRVPPGVGKGQGHPGTAPWGQMGAARERMSRHKQRAL